MNNYRWLKDHSISHTIPNMTTDPVVYVQEVLDSWSESSSVRIVFAPADIKCRTHEDMRDLFLERGYWVYIDNSERKGFYNPRGRFQSVNEFRSEHNIHGEPYEVFMKWKSLYPEECLAITGWLTIIRGITFNTTGFNFTNVILSACHMRNLADLLQVAGRANGDITYVSKFMIDCPKSLWDILNERIQLMSELHEKDVKEFEERDFRPKTKREEQEPAWTVPRVFMIGEEKYATIQKKSPTSNIWDTDTIFAVIDDESLVKDLQRRKKAKGQFQITQPEKPDTYKKYITDFVQKSVENRLFNMGLHPKDKDKDGYQIFLDNKEHRIIVSIYNGTKLKPDTTTFENTIQQC
jgi:hypothetical protein